SRVLVIYTGGTIGMMHDKVNGYSPAKGYLPEKLKSIGRFHDPAGVENSDDDNDDHGIGSPSLLSDWLITPRSIYNRRVQYCFLEYDPLLDSCNMDMTDWVRIVKDIERFYDRFDAFIILHGTDTMSYTASALSFMLQNLGKSVIVTGSQVPIAEMRNDGIENFLGALTIAGHFVIPEVSLYFNNKLFRGNRSVKADAMDFDAFMSPNLPPLVKVGVDIEVNWPEVLRPNAIEPFFVHKQMNSNVATLRLFPGILPSAIRAFLAPPIAGIVLETYGAGNAPDTTPAILEALAEASKRGVVIVNVTQCQRGNVSDLYATARGLTRAQVVPGRDMTSECALTKLSYLLGRGFSPERCREMLSRSLRGELTVVVELGSGQITASEHGPMSHDTVTERASIYRSFFPVLLCAAAATGDLQGMYLLEEALNKALEVTCYDYTGQTPLHSAVRSGQLPCARFLMKRGASVHILSRQGHTPLFAAISSRRPEMVSLLLKAGAHFSDAEIRDLMLYVQNAVSRGDIELIKLVVRAGFDVNTSDHEGRTILFFAVIACQVEIVEYLLSLPGVSIEHWDHWGHNPMD
ncbi:asparaginase-domain-containing protein, partial [Coemansia reversa NRRL 1564]